jgi:tripartite-type tricarboxylate transporter receptor subunit TctC
MRLHVRLAGAALVACAAAALPAAAQEYPHHPVKIVSPYPPGGTTDILARMLSPKLSAALGQPVVVDNKAGASGNIGTEFVARAAPDGYTLLMGNNTGVVINRNLYKLNVDPPQALVPVILVAQVPTVLYVHPSVPASTLQEFVALVRKSPGKFSFASAGSGSPQHLAGEMLKSAFDLDMVHIPYKGSGPAITDVVAGQVPVGFESTVVLQPFVDSGRARPLATTGAKRSISLPNVPTMMESGAKDFDVTNWYGLFAPAGTPREIVERLNAEVRKAMDTPELKDRLAKMGSAVVPGTADEFAQFVRAEVPRAAELVRKSGAKVD